MRILHLLASPAWSGPAELIATLALAQRALGHEVHVAVDRKRAETRSEESSVPRLEQLGLLDDGGLELSVKSLPLAIIRDIAALRRRQVDVLHAHFTHDHLLARWGRRRTTLLVRSVHAPRSLRASLPWAAGYTVPSVSLSSRLSGRRVKVLPPLVDGSFAPPSDKSALRLSLGLPSDAPLIGMVSTFQASRRHHVALTAFARVHEKAPKARLVLVGDGALEPQLRAQVDRLGLSSSVIFAGYQSGSAFVRWLQALDEVWILGLGNDWSGRAAAQARACGVRVVAVDEGGLPSFADAVLPTPSPTDDAEQPALVQALVEESLRESRRAITLPSPEDRAREVLAFYEQCAGATKA